MSVDERLKTLLTTQGLADLVAAYFTPSHGFAADTFDTLGNNDPYAVTVDDLLAVSLLDVRIPPVAVRGLLGADRGQVAKLLHRIDPDRDLWASGRADALEAAGALWTWVRGYREVGPVIAGKLLARKRPRLIPIVDSVVIDSLRADKFTYWESIAAALENPERRAQVEDLRPEWLTPAVTTLRLLDVAMWMRGSRSETARAVRHQLGVPEPDYRTGRGD